jgi:hypothetical protein
LAHIVNPVLIGVILMKEIATLSDKGQIIGVGVLFLKNGPV